MKYVILIHSNPQPWGHPTIAFTEAGRAVSEEDRAAGDQSFEAFFDDLIAGGEFVSAEALGDPAGSTVHRWEGRGPKGAHVVSEGPYAEAGEHLAGFFIIDVATPERAKEVAGHFAGPGDTIELRPMHTDE